MHHLVASLVTIMMFAAGGGGGAGPVAPAQTGPTPTQAQSSASSGPTARQVTEHLCNAYDYRPARITVACGDGNAEVVRLHWSEWTAARAVGFGTWRQNDCEPYCAAGKFHDYPVRLALTEPMHTGQRPFFGPEQGTARARVPRRSRGAHEQRPLTRPGAPATTSTEAGWWLGTPSRAPPSRPTAHRACRGRGHRGPQWGPTRTRPPRPTRPDPNNHRGRWSRKPRLARHQPERSGIGSAGAARDWGGSKGSAKYWVSWATRPAENSMMLTEWVGKPS
jgi:hypothetical protein